MKKSITAILILISTQIIGQPEHYFFGQSSEDTFQQIVETSDGNLLIIGTKREKDRSIWLIKTTTNGETIWERNFSDSSNFHDELGFGLKLDTDGGFLITGTSSSSHSGGIFIKTDSEGNLIWKNYLPQATAFSDILPTEEGYLLVGWKDVEGSSYKVNALVVFTDKKGHVSRSKILNTSQQTRMWAKKVFQKSTDQFSIFGRFMHDQPGDDDPIGAFVININKNGTIQNSEFHNLIKLGQGIPGYPHDFHEPLAVVQMPDSSYFLSNTETENYQSTILHLSPEGKLLKKYSYENLSEVREYPTSINPLENGGFLVIGNVLRRINEIEYRREAFAFEVNNVGRMIWRKYYPSYLAFSSLISNSGEKFLCGKKRFQGSDVQGWLFKLGKNGIAFPYEVRAKIIADLNENCIADSNEPPLSGWFIKETNTNVPLAISDKNGIFHFNTEKEISAFYLVCPNPSIWDFCNQEVVILNTHPAQEDVVFLVNQKDANCPKPEVHLTMPDLRRCSTSQVFATVTNQGFQTTNGLNLVIDLDDDLQLKSANLPYSQNGSNIEINIDSMNFLEKKVIEFGVESACNTQIGAAHPISARIEPIHCEMPFEGAFFTVSGKCEGEEVIFKLENSNPDFEAESTFEVAANSLTLFENKKVNFTKTEPIHEIRFPADGRTWRLDLSQNPEFEKTSLPHAVVEGCGIEKSGLAAVGHQTTFRRTLEPSANTSVFPVTSTGIPPKIMSHTSGTEVYGFLDGKKPFEFTARLENPLTQTVDSITFEFSFEGFDPATFQAFSAIDSTEILLTDWNAILVKMKNTAIEPNDEIAFNFSVSPKITLPVADLIDNALRIDGLVQLNDESPINLRKTYNYLQWDARIFADDYPAFIPEAAYYGGRFREEAGQIRKGLDGSIYFSGSTKSFSKSTHEDGMIAKINQGGELEYFNAIDFGDQQNNKFNYVLPQPDGSCFVAGEYDSTGVFNTSASIAKLDTKGNLLWSKILSLGTFADRTLVKGLEQLPNNEILLYGASQAGSVFKYFFAKLNDKGEIIQLNQSPGPFYDIVPIAVVLEADGSIVAITTSDIIKITVDNEILWYKKPPFPGLVNFYDFCQKPNGSYLAVGYIRPTNSSGTTEVYPIIANFSENGDLDSFEILRADVFFEGANLNGIKPDPQGGYYTFGFTENTIHSNLLLMKLDENGAPIWWEKYGSEASEQIVDMTISDKNELFLWCSSIYWDLPRRWQSFLLRTSADGELITSSTVEKAFSTQIIVFPNPAQEEANVLLSPAPRQLTNWILYNLNGSKIDSGQTITGGFSINTSGFSNGMYILQFPNSDFPTRKILVEK